MPSLSHTIALRRPCTDAAQSATVRSLRITFRALSWRASSSDATRCSPVPGGPDKGEVRVTGSRVVSCGTTIDSMLSPVNPSRACSSSRRLVVRSWYAPAASPSVTIAIRSSGPSARSTKSRAICRTLRRSIRRRVDGVERQHPDAAGERPFVAAHVGLGQRLDGGGALRRQVHHRERLDRLRLAVFEHLEVGGRGRARSAPPGPVTRHDQLDVGDLRLERGQGRAWRRLRGRRHGAASAAAAIPATRRLTALPTCSLVDTSKRRNRL